MDLKLIITYKNVKKNLKNEIRSIIDILKLFCLKIDICII